MSTTKPAEPLPPYVLEPHDCGLRQGIDPSRFNSLSDELEVEDFLRETGAQRRALSRATPGGRGGRGSP